MAEQPSSAWTSGGSAPASTSVSGSTAQPLSTSSAGGGGTSAPSAVGGQQPPPPHSDLIAVNSSSSASLSRGGHNSRKRGHQEKRVTSVERGGKRSRASSSPASGRRSTSSGSVTERGRPRGRGSSKASSSTVVTGPRTRHAPSSSSVVAEQVLSPKRSTESSKSRGGTASSSVDPKNEANKRESLRGRRAVTVASTTATASAAATAAAVTANKNKSNQRGRLSAASTSSTRDATQATAPISSRKRGLAYSAATSASSSTSSLLNQTQASSSTNNTFQPPRRKYPLRNQVRLVPGSEEPVPLDIIRPPPEYYPPSNLGHHRRASAVFVSSTSRQQQQTRATRASLSSLPATPSASASEKRARTSPQQQQQLQNSSSPLISLRRSSRSKPTTGSCASSSGRRTSRGGTKLPLTSSSPSGSSATPGPSSSSSSGGGPSVTPLTAATSSVIVSSAPGTLTAMAEGGGWEGLAEAAASSSSARGTPPPLPPPLLSSSTSATPTLLAAAMTTSGGAQQAGASATSAAVAADSESDDSEVGLSCTSTSMLLQPNSSSAAASSGSSSQLLARTASSVGRLQALLEARGLPPHLFGALGPRMQHLLHRSMGGSSSGSAGSSSKVQQLLQGLTATGDEGAQLTAVIEMCQMLVMGNEDTLAGFPVKQVVPALITLLSMEHNFDMMNHACRALTYMMEALPRSSAVVVDAVPVFLEKLQVIQCMDVAEQSLTALEMLSRRHGKAILQARGVSSCLTYLDFFSINAQRAALATTANCCMNLHPDEFHLVSDSLPLLASRLTQQDKRSMESVCLAFSRLVDSFQLDPVRLRSVASAELLANLQRLLVVSPQLVSTGTFITVLRMLSVMCANCPALARDLLRHNVADTLLFLLTGNATSVSNNEDVELVSRSPQELYEITCLIGELMPRLPTDGLFAVDALLERAPPMAQDAVSWQWRDDRELWHPYSTMDSRIIEAAHQGGEDEISLSTLGRTYTLDFHSMQQINEDTGTTRPVHRRVLPTGVSGSRVSITSGQPTCEQDQSVEADNDEERLLAAGFIRSLFSVLYEVYSSSAGPAVRCKCLRALLRMVHFATANLLREVLRNQVVSSHLAGMLASADLRIVVGALQMAYILMQKLPAEFGVHFRREGVMHQIQRLADTPLPQTPGPSSAQGSPANGALPLPQLPTHSSAVRNLLLSDSTMEDERSSSPHVRVLADVLKRKRSTPKRGPSSSSRKTRQDEAAAASLGALAAVASPSSSSSAVAREFFRATPSFGSAGGSSSSRSGTPTTGATSGATPFTTSSSSSGGRSRFSGAKSSFLASLNPARWGRSSTTGNASSTSAAATLNGQGGPELRHKDSLTPLSKSCSAGGLAAGNKEKARTWVREQAQRFVELYFDSEASGPPHPALSVLSRLTQAIERLRTQPWQGESALRDLRDIVLTSDISPFEVNHSGLISALLQYLTAESTPDEPLNNNNEEEASSASDRNTPDSKPGVSAAVVPAREHKLRIFLHIFSGCPRDANWLELPESPSTEQTAALSALVSKLLGCVAQLEQFPVKVHDLPSGTSGAGRGGGTSALKFFNTHQLKCNLQRHPSCNSLRQWKGGTVKIDPLALVQAIERYLVVRGYGRLREKDSADSDDETEEDIDDTLAAVVMSQGSARHKLQFLMGEQPLPYNMTVYQAVRQYGASASSAAAGADQSETDTDSEAPLAHAGLWVQTHTIYYRPAPEEETGSSNTAPTSSTSTSTTSTSATTHHSGRKGKGSGSKSNSRRKAASDGQIRAPLCPLVPFLQSRLPDNVTVQDASLDVLCLLRVLHALSRHWGALFSLPSYRPLLSQQEFLSSKISAKASRQLQDPLVIMTGNLPAWLQQVASACPFLFPFETRQLLFYATSFDRDRALQRLLEASPELNSAEAHERVTPRLDRRKRVVSRSDILRQAEQVVQDLAASRALLEVQYENEVGTGLGPTLEFYALVSRELQRADLELWLGDTVSGGLDGQTQYVHAPNGLFPSPLARNAKVVQVARVKAKFRFLGRLMAKAVMDSRMLDLPLSRCLYRTLLAEGQMLSLSDLVHVSPAVHATLGRLLPLARQHAAIESDPALTPAQKKEAQEALTLDGAPISAIELDFTLPGHPQVELRKGGRDTPVTIHNLESYIKLVCHWYLSEGVSKQMESLRDGFEAVFPLEHLRLFYPEELEAVFCGSSGASSWDVRTLMECCRSDHGYTPDSRAIRFLFEILASYDREEQRQFVQFITGSPKLPVGGFKSLNPPLTVVRKTLEHNMDPDEFLPSVMTCVNYLKLPDYSSIEVMRAKLRTAAQEGQHSFHLS